MYCHACIVSLFSMLCTVYPDQQEAAIVPQYRESNETLRWKPKKAARVSELCSQCPKCEASCKLSCIHSLRKHRG